MSADSRSVSTDALETLGTIIGEGEARDAIHLAVEPVEAAHHLSPGQHIGLDQDGKANAFAAKLVGIVDPFLDRMVAAGERFWLVVYPRQIKSLRHVWEHPDFPDSRETVVREAPGITTIPPSSLFQDDPDIAWIGNYARELSGEYDGEQNDITYEELMDCAHAWCKGKSGRGGGEYIVRGSLLVGVGTDPEFWVHFKNITGLEPTGKDKAPSFFSCSC